MPNMAQAISRHNKTVLKGNQEINPQPGCNCLDGPDKCPVQGKCKSTAVVYSASVTETQSGKVETYAGLTSRTFKTRFNEHNNNMNNPGDRSKSKLSAHVWDLKDRGISYEVKWKLLDSPQFSTPSRKNADFV